MKTCWQTKVSVHNSRDFLLSFLSLSTQCQGYNTIPWHLLLFVSLRAATVRLPFLNIGMRPFFGADKDYHHRVSWGPQPELCCAEKRLTRHGERYALCERTTSTGVVMGIETNKVVWILLNLCAITSNKDTCWTLSLVKEVAVDGEQGATHYAASGRGHSRHLWITNRDALTTNCATGSNSVRCDKTSPANVWIMAFTFVPKILNTSLFDKLLEKNSNKSCKNKCHHHWCDPGLK